MRPEPRLRRRRAARSHQLPQLRQSREAGRRLAARPLDPGPRGCLRGARRARGRRQRLALQRDRGRTDLPNPGGRHGRRAPRPRARRGPEPYRRGGDRGLRPVLALARRLGAGEAAWRARPRAAVAADRSGDGGDRRGPRGRPGGARGGRARHLRRRARLRPGRDGDRRWRRARGRPRRAGRGARVLRRDGAVRRGARRLHPRRRSRRPGERGHDRGRAVRDRPGGRRPDLGRRPPRPRPPWRWPTPTGPGAPWASAWNGPPTRNERPCRRTRGLCDARSSPSPAWEP